MDSAFVPFHRPSIGPEEAEALNQVLRSKWLTTGPVAQQFENEFAKYIGCKYSLAVNSATAALQLAMDVIGLKPGDEVLVPTYTFTATAEIVTYFGGHPVLCDSVPGGFNVDPRDMEAKVTARTRAVIPVHFAGEPCDLDYIHKIAAKNGMHVIEDAAHSLPATYKGRRIGTTSTLTAFSFYATKTITTAEGGMLTTDNEEFARRAASMRLHGISGDAWKRYSRNGSWFYEVVDAGYKLNLPDLLAALGRAQLYKCDAFWQKRHQIAERYLESFAPFEELECPPKSDSVNGSDHAWHLFVLRIKPDTLAATRNQVIDELRAAGIGTSVHFIPLHLHPYYSRTYGYRMGELPCAEDAYARCISLPIFPDMTDQEINQVIAAVQDTVYRNRKRLFQAAG